MTGRSQESLAKAAARKREGRRKSSGRCIDCGAEISPAALRCKEHGQVITNAVLPRVMRSLHRERLGWLPDERRDDYKRLIKCYPEPIAKQMVLDDMRAAQ